jgi:hypothetical protein
VHNERIPRDRAFHIKWPGQRIPARRSADSLGIRASRIYGPRFDSVSWVDVQRRLDRIREEMVELGRLERMSPGRRRLRRLPPGLPLQINLLLDNRSGPFDAVVLQFAMQLDGCSWIRPHGALDLAILEGPFEGIIPEFAGQLGSVEFEL